MSEASTVEKQTKGRPRWVIPTVIATLVLALIAGGLLLLLRDPVVIDERLEDAPDVAQVKEMDIQPLEGEFVVDSLGLAMPLEEMSIVGGVINPPELEKAYTVRDYAEPGDPERMAVVALHSISTGDVPGNKLIDVKNAEATLEPGDTIVVQGHEYEVTTTFAQNKETAALDNALWEDRPGKLLVFTCLQLPEGGPTVDNVIIQAQLVE